MREINPEGKDLRNAGEILEDVESSLDTVSSQIDELRNIVKWLCGTTFLLVCAILYLMIY